MADRIATTRQVRAWRDLEAHRWWAYRACAPAVGAPSRARGDRSVAITVWQTPDGERQKARLDREEQALTLCLRCPIREQCLAYALGDEGGPYEPWDIWGAMTAHQRDQLLRERRRVAAAEAAAMPADVPEPVLASALDLTVLRALAAHRTPEAVARAASMTVTRANWHRSRLMTLLHLDSRTTTRMRLLYAARLTGLLDPAAPYLADRDRVIAAVPSRQGAVLRSRGVQLFLPGMHDYTPRPVSPLPPRPRPPVLPAGPGALYLVPAAELPTARTVLAVAA